MDLSQLQNSCESSPKTKPFSDQSEKRVDNNLQELEVVLVPFASIPENEMDVKTAKKKSTPRKRSKTVSTRSKLNEVPVPETRTPSTKRSSRLQDRSKSCYVESPLKSPKGMLAADPMKTSPAEEPKTPVKYRSPRMSKRSKSCYVEDVMLSPLKPQIPVTVGNKEVKNLCVKTSPPEPSKPGKAEKKSSPRLASRSKSCLMERPLALPKSPTADKLNELPIPVAQIPTKNCSPRLLSRSKSCYIESPTSLSRIPTVDQREELPTKKIVAVAEVESSVNARFLDRSYSSDQSIDATKNLSSSNLQPPLNVDSSSAKHLESNRGPVVIEPPHLPKNRGKLRGLSATSKENELKNKILDRQRSLDYQAQMKKKWFQKPKDKKRECQEIKEKRREELKKLTDKPKPNDTAKRADAHKRKITNIPTLGNCNRGDFLSKEVQPPTTKKPRLENAQAKPKKPAPQRRATIESFSQQLCALDLIKNLPDQTSRPKVRKDAERARNQRTCNRVSFAEMEREFDLRHEREKRAKNSRRVRFSDNIQIKIIERVEGAYRKVGNIKDTKKITLSTYAERRAWSQAQGKLENFSDLIMGNILSWANQWLQLRSADAVTESEVLIPIPNEFKSYKQYKEYVELNLDLIIECSNLSFYLQIQNFHTTDETGIADHHRTRLQNFSFYV